MNERLEAMGIRTIWDAAEAVLIRPPDTTGNLSLTAEDLTAIWDNLDPLIDAWVAEKEAVDAGGTRVDRMWDAHVEATFVMQHIAGHPHLPPDLAMYIAEAVVAAQPRKDDAIPTGQGTRIHGANAYVMYELAINPVLTREHLRCLMAASSTFASVARNPSTPPDMLHELVDRVLQADPDFDQHYLIQGLVANANLPVECVPDIVDYLLTSRPERDYDEESHRAAVGTLLDPDWWHANAVTDEMRSHLIVHTALL